MNTVTERPHHEAGFSRIGILATCPGALTMWRLVPDDGRPVPAHTESGTRVHAATEGQDVQLTDAEAALAASIARNLEARLEGADEVLVEHFLQVHVPGSADALTAGYLDRLGLWSHDGVTDRAAIVELKTGFAVHEQLLAWQIEAQVLAVFQNFPEVSFVTAYGFNPRLQMERAQNFSRKVDEERLLWKIANVIARAEKGPTTLRSSTETCGICRAASICPEVHREAYALTHDRGRLDLGSVPTPRLFDMLTKARIVKKIEDDIAKEAKRRAAFIVAAGDPLPDGWQLNEVRGTRFVPDPTAAFTAMIAAGMTRDEFLRAVEVQVGKLEAAYVEHEKTVGAGGTVAAIKRRFEELSAGSIDRGPPTTRLVLKGDPR